MGQSWYGVRLVPDGAKRGVAGTTAISPATQAAHCTHRDPESRIQTSQNGPLPARLPRLSRQQEAGDHSCAYLHTSLTPGDSRLLRHGRTGLHKTVWLRGRSVRRCEGVHMDTRDCLGMAGAHWPVLLQLQPAGAVGCGGVVTERNVLSRFLVHCISLVYPGTEHTT